MRRIIFTPMGYMNPNSGGMYVLEQHMAILKKAGYDVHILYRSDKEWNAFHHLSYSYPSIGFDNNSNTTWTLSSTESRIKCVSHIKPSDLVVISEEFVWFGIKEIVPRNINYVILNQGISATFYSFYESSNDIKKFYDNAKKVLVNSNHTKAGVKKIFNIPDNKISKFIIGIDDALFYTDKKENIICYTTQKNSDIGFFIEQYLKLKYPEITILRIENTTREIFANILGKSKIFISLGGPEGFGLPPIEAAFAGCRVIGFDGYGGAEYFREPTFIRVNQHDYLDFLNKIDNVMEDINNENLYDYEYMKILKKKYSLENARNSILDIYSNIE